MRLTKHTDFALRILVYSAMEAGEGRLLSVQEVTDAFEVPRTHVMKIVQKLGQLGYLQTFRGKGGGFRLGMQPEDINLAEVVKAMESSITLVECEEIACRDCSTCQLKAIMNQAMAAFFNVLAQYSLADALDKKNGLLTHLSFSRCSNICTG
ncbi:RrF2 family transcriptional regulator [Endozoicomonas euniceicola]|uniref:Rrf2 family transcriptional regulator n=1 Tax=Endozoicomonas euniceicola TaxID=1234143 RepID=A0ABY6GNJ7_9GAMM|nr:Rrf2 family transcriptional regulator [Endozoicomonas euniceicola]UYM14102.1 Rrf2 family transcriptional regulator [Endozoicomonas euniceicola]